VRRSERVGIDGGYFNTLGSSLGILVRQGVVWWRSYCTLIGCGGRIAGGGLSFFQEESSEVMGAQKSEK